MGQVQSRQSEEGYFKLQVSEKDALIEKYTGKWSGKPVL